MGRVGDDAAIYFIIVKTREEPTTGKRKEKMQIEPVFSSVASLYR